MPWHPSPFFIPPPQYNPWRKLKLKKNWRDADDNAANPPQGRVSGGTAGLRRTYFSNSSSESIPDKSKHNPAENDDKGKEKEKWPEDYYRQ